MRFAPSAGAALLVLAFAGGVGAQTLAPGVRMVVQSSPLAGFRYHDVFRGLGRAADHCRSCQKPSERQYEMARSAWQTSHSLRHHNPVPFSLTAPSPSASHSLLLLRRQALP